MFKKENRLSRNEINELKKTSSQNNILQGRFLGLIYKKTDLQKKFGFIISNKIAPLAVERNRVKRMAFLSAGKIFTNENGLFLFLAKRTCIQASAPEMLQEMENFKSKVI